MQRPSLSRLAIVLVTIIVFFSLLTQRIMLQSENATFEKLVAGRGQIMVSNATVAPPKSRLNRAIAAMKDIAQVDWFTSRPNIPMAQLDETSVFIPMTTSNSGNHVMNHNPQTVSTSKTLKPSKASNIFVAPEPTTPSSGVIKTKPQTVENRTDIKPLQLRYDNLNYHPRISPRNGTDISPQHQMALLLCPNQSKCIVPALQLKIKMKIYFCRHPTRQGVRFYFLAKEGFILHPNVEMIPFNKIDEADFIVYLPGSAPWHLTECSNISFSKRLIVLDEFDGHTLFEPRRTQEEMVHAYGPAKHWYFIYFKRSFVRRSDGKFMRYPHLTQRDVYPMTYALAETYLQHKFNFKREIEIVCTLRGNKHMTTRQRVQDWIAEYASSRQVANVITGQINNASRQTVSKSYFEQMFNAQIIVTVNPANWEGDFRLWEAMATGALVMVDPVFVPHQYPLLDGVHVIYFSNQNKSDLFEKLDYYRQHKDEARKIAINGYLHAMKYHRTVNLADYILRTTHVKRTKLRKNELPNYKYTGQYLNNITMIQHEEIIMRGRPGKYHHHDEHHYHPLPREHGHRSQM